MSAAAPRPRVLLAITVYNGRAFVPRCIESATRLRTDTVDVDVLVLDDASPEPGFSEWLEGLCAELGVGYYCTPRNLGIVRNVNLGLLRGLDAGYDGVIISNSDVIYSETMADRLWSVAASDPRIGSVTAWSNNVSAYSLPNEDPDAHLGHQEVVNETSEVLWREFGRTSVDVPAGISFSMLFTRKALETVGLMDPVFGRGYCEETDWSRRSLQAGFRLVLAPGIYVYHEGRGSTMAAGMLSAGHTTVPANEAIIKLRYPTFHDEVGHFVLESGVLPDLWERASKALVCELGEREGYTLDISVFDRQPGAGAPPVRGRIFVDGEGTAWFAATGRGFWHRGSSSATGAGTLLRESFGRLPTSIRLYEEGAAAEQVARDLLGPSGVLEDHRGYPERV